MIVTLFAPWHKDRVSLQQGSMSGMAKALAWNVISRFIGMIVRLSVIASFLLSEYFFVLLAASVFTLFVLWPVLVVYGVVISIEQLLSL